MSNYKVISSSCYGGNKVFYAGDIFKNHDVSEQDLIQLLKGGFIEETEEEANKSSELPVEEIVIEHEEKKLIEPLEIEVEETEEEEIIDPSELLGNKNQGKNSGKHSK